MNEGLLSAIRERRPWLERFTRTEYEQAFQEYRKQYEELFREALRNADADSLAAETLGELEKGWKAEKFWKRPARRFEEKQMIFMYLSPMLLEMGEEAFAAALRDAWRRRSPKDAYEVVTWRKLKKGFRLTVMGIEVGRGDDED
ncbi:MAG: hypothetical protein IKN96_02015 [Oscillibacter sp.]|nr:hypothetical protein [Oscillibacter sp.]